MSNVAYVPISSPEALSFGSNGVWTDTDLDDYIENLPDDVSGVLIRLQCSSGLTHGGVRKNGSTDTYIHNLTTDAHHEASCGVDGDNIFELYREDSDVTGYIMGYFRGGASFLENGVALTPSVGSYQDVDITAYTNGVAIGAILQTRIQNYAGIRKNGSTDDLYGMIQPITNELSVVGVDDDEVFEIKQEYNYSPSGTFYLLGYVVSGAVLHTNATDVTPTIDGNYHDLAALPAGAVAGIYFFNGTCDFGIRENGSAFDIFLISQRAWFIAKCDSNGICEAAIENGESANLYEIGYFTAEEVSGGGAIMY